MIDPVVFYKSRKIASLADAALLDLCGRAGTAGLVEAVASEALRMNPTTTYSALRRLVDVGLVHPPTRDTKQGRPNRYVITPAGLEILQRVERVVLPAQQMPIGI